MSILSTLFLFSFLFLISFQGITLYKRTTCRQVEWKKDFELKTARALSEGHNKFYVPQSQCKARLNLPSLGAL